MTLTPAGTSQSPAPQTQAQQSQAPQSQVGQAPTKTGAAPSDYKMFLRLLTTQMTNQDPMNPMDSSQYAVQLATFSQVEQQTKTNDLLAGLGAQFTTMGLAQLAPWVGKSVLVDAPVAFDGAAVRLRPTFAAGADRAVLVVKDAAGATVAREDIPVTAGSDYTWMGAGAAGDRLPAGRYSLSIESWRGGVAQPGATAAPAFARVSEVRAPAPGATDGPHLVLQGGAEVAATAVLAVE